MVSSQSLRGLLGYADRGVKAKMYDKKILQKLVKKYERKAGISLMLYQETGNQKREKISEEAEIIAAALRVMLVDAERDEEHQQAYALL